MSQAISAPFTEPLDDASEPRTLLRLYSKIVCAAVLFLLFAGSMVTSHNAGLAVPDWPTTYGQNMFTYPVSKWQGPIFFEHSHRLIAAVVGMLIVGLCTWLFVVEKRTWVKLLGTFAVAAVVLQGVLGGLTVLYGLPPLVSTAHAILGQTVFALTLIIAYSQSKEASSLERVPTKEKQKIFIFSIVCIVLLFVQLFFGGLMRHTDSAIAVPDFPTTAGNWLPLMTSETLIHVNSLRANLHLAPVTETQILYHMLHRVGALFVTIALLALLSLTFIGTRLNNSPDLKFIRRTGALIGAALVTQVLLGAFTVLSVRDPIVASAHVVVGACLLGFVVLLGLRAYCPEE